MKGIRVTEDNYKFYLSIEKSSQENRDLITKITNMVDEPVSKLDGLIPELPTSEPAPDIVPSKGYVAYVEAVEKYKRGELSGDEKKSTLEKIKKMAEILKKGRPKSDDDLKYCIYNMSKVFSERIEKEVLTGLGMSSEELRKADVATLERAYNMAIGA